MNKSTPNDSSSTIFDQAICQHLQIAVAVICPKSYQIIHYNHQFCQRCIGPLSDAELTIESIFPNLNISMLEKALDRNSIYRYSVEFKESINIYPVDFTFTLITIDGQNYILAQGQDNLQNLEFKNMINSYDAIFKAQTKELTEEKEKSQKASEFKTQFLSRISHELRTPMNAILGFAQLQDMELVGQQQLWQNNQQILDSGYDMVDLLDKMYAFVETQNPQNNVVIAPCSLQQQLKEAIKHANQHIRHHSVTINHPNKDIIVKADGVRLSRILQEIIGNGIKFNNPNGQLDIQFIENQDGTVELIFRDSADNIDDDEIDKIFTPFFRARYAKENEISGIGIGLVLSQRHASSMNANLHVSKDTEKGGIVVYLNLEKTKVQQPLEM